MLLKPQLECHPIIWKMAAINNNFEVIKMISIIQHLSRIAHIQE
jgi:hypothetical protein